MYERNCFAGKERDENCGYVCVAILATCSRNKRKRAFVGFAMWIHVRVEGKLRVTMFAVWPGAGLTRTSSSG